MFWLFVPSSVTLAAAAVLAGQCRRLYCQLARCRATLADTPNDHPAETPRT